MYETLESYTGGGAGDRRASFRLFRRHSYHACKLIQYMYMTYPLFRELGIYRSGRLDTDRLNYLRSYRYLVALACISLRKVAYTVGLYE